MNLSTKLITIYFLFHTTIPKVNSIRCFQCNSNDNSGCTTLENYRKQLFYPIPCEDDFGRKAFCRKTVLQIIEKGKQHEPRVIRSCGYYTHKNPCYRTDNGGHTETVCQCFEDGCNSANILPFKTSLFVISLILNTLLNISI